jgi:hypothetical protein
MSPSSLSFPAALLLSNQKSHLSAFPAENGFLPYKITKFNFSRVFSIPYASRRYYVIYRHLSENHKGFLQLKKPLSGISAEKWLSIL